MGLRALAGKAVKTTVLTCCVCMLAVLAPLCAMAQASTLDCGNGWVLNITQSGDNVTVTGVATQGTGSLAIPASTDGKNRVTTIGTQAFQNANGLKTVSLPDTLTNLESNAFFGSGLTSISIPASVESLPVNCFRNCAGLSEVNFAKGMTLRFIDQRAFGGCSSLKEISIPPLTGGTTTTGTGIGPWAFADCTSLEKMFFLAGGKNSASNYFYNVGCVQNCPKLKDLVFFCKKGSLKSGVNTVANADYTCYYSVDFYASEEDAASKTNRIACVVLREGVPFVDLTSGTVSAEDIYEGYDAIPMAPSGKVWGISDHAVTDEHSTLGNHYDAVAVNSDDMRYGYLTSPEYYSYSHDGTMGIANNTPARASRYFLNDDGKSVDISNLLAYGPDFKPLNLSTYAFKYWKYRVVLNQGIDKSAIDEVPEITEAGIYKVVAVGKGSNEGVELEVRIYVDACYFPDTSFFMNADLIEGANTLIDKYAVKQDTPPYFVCVAPASDWRYCLIASGLAGVGEGFVTFAGSNDGTGMYRAITDSKTDAVNIIGGYDLVSRDVENRIKSLGNMQGGGSVDRFDGATPQAVALSVYETIKTYGTAFGYNWGTTAVVANPTSCQDSVLAARRAHMEKAPVFFTNDDGSLSAELVAALKEGDFEKVYIAGSEIAASAATVDAVKSATGVEPERICEGSGLWDASVQDTAEVDSTHMVVASGKNPVSIIAACEAAAMSGAKLQVLSSSEEVAALVDYIDKNGKRSLEMMEFVGDFDTYATDLKGSLDNYWQAGTLSGQNVPATFSSDGFLYKVTGDNTVALCGFQGVVGKKSLRVDTVEHGGKTYSVTAVEGVSLASTGFTSVSLGSSVKSASSGFFKSAKSLSDVRIEGLKSVEASAFAGCSSLKNVTIASSVLTSIGKSAFSGCSKLASVTVSSTALKSIGASAFSGCKALKKITFKSSKIASVGSAAFKGTYSKISVKAPSKKLKTYKKLFVKNGMSKKAIFAKA